MSCADYMEPQYYAAACRTDHHHGPHFLLLPFVEQGHITPMLHLASQLASDPKFDCMVTFVNATEPALAAAGPASANSLMYTAAPPVPQSSACCPSYSTVARINGSCKHVVAHDLLAQDHDSILGDRLRFVRIRASLAPAAAASVVDKQLQHVSMSSRNMVFRQKLAALEEQKPLIEKIVLQSKASADPISCIICDLLLWKWVRKVAEKHGVQLACLLTSGALAFFAGYSIQMGKEAQLEELLVSSFHLPSKDDSRRFGLFNIRDPPDVRMQKRKHYSALFEGLHHEDAHILVNSFEKLEEPLLPWLQASGLTIKFVGPLGLAAWGGDHNKNNVGVANRMARRAGSTLMVQEEECLAWLNRQAKKSVLFVSFGSEGVLEAAQVEEIAMGIHNSGCSFLWVVRPDMPAGSRPSEAFSQCSRQQGTGMFVSWAPQRAVLQHMAVGGFLTHSGWNSTLESLSYGVPMLCLPLIADQPLNANLVQCYWQVGLRLDVCGHAADAGNVGQSYVVSRADVERGIRAILLQGCFSHKAAHLQHAAQAAVHGAYRNLTSFVHSIKRPGK